MSSAGLRRRVLAAVLAAALAVGALALGGVDRHRPNRSQALLSGVALPAPVRPAFHVPTPRPLPDRVAAATWAPVLAPVAAHAAPSGGSRSVTRLEPRTPEGTTNIVRVLGHRADGAGVWVKVSLPVLPNGSVGWVRRGALGGYAGVTTHLVVDLRRLTATLTRNGRRVFVARVGVGKPATPTPRGDFYVRDRLAGFHNPVYGPVAFGTSARSTVLTDWPGGGFVGIHGTNEPRLIPGRISHGCIRLRNRDIVRLSRLMPVGTPLTVR